MTLGLFVALFMGLLMQALFGLGYVFAIPIVLFSVMIGLVGMLGGRKLHKMGTKQFEDAKLDTVRGLAGHRNGVLTALHVAQALNIPVDEADAMLTELAKRPDENVGLDVDDDGQLSYLFGCSDAMRWRIKAERAGITDQQQSQMQAEIEAQQAEMEASQQARRHR